MGLRDRLKSLWDGARYLCWAGVPRGARDDTSIKSKSKGDIKGKGKGDIKGKDKSYIKGKCKDDIKGKGKSYIKRARLAVGD